MVYRNTISNARHRSGSYHNSVGRERLPGSVHGRDVYSPIGEELSSAMESVDPISVQLPTDVGDMGFNDLVHLSHEGSDLQLFTNLKVKHLGMAL